ncbi:GldG family protein [Endothiovibrio diazotrophicus]
MEVTRRSRLRIRLQNALFVVLFLATVALLAWLSTRYVVTADWTAGGRNTLSAESAELLATLDQPVEITAYATEDPVLRGRIQELVKRYQRHKADIALHFVNPEAEPARVRDLGITVDGELVVAVGDREEQLQQLSEQALTNALQRAARGGERWMIFVSGHGERDPLGQANHDLGKFGGEMERRGFKLRTLNLAKEGTVPDNTTALVIAGPRTTLLPGEVTLIERYVRDGGNLLWLGDPGDTLLGLQPLADRLGINFLPGTVVDATTQLFGIDNPSFALVTDYLPNPITGEFELTTLFPQAAALDFEAPEGWEGEPILETLPRSWTETGELSGNIRFDEDQGERSGPLTLGISLTRSLDGDEPKDGAPEEEGEGDEGKGAEQRVVVIGDGDFLSNAYLGNGGNLDLGLALFQWLGHDDRFIAIRAKSAPDLTLTLSDNAVMGISVLFLFALPLGLLGSGLFIWWRRRNR